MGATASIVIVTHNNINYTRQCLESIFAKTDNPEIEVILVDNASEDGTPQYLKKFAKTRSNVRIILNPTDEGFARAINLGAEAATGQYLVFLNNEFVVTNGWLAGLIRHLKDPSVGIVGPVTNFLGNEGQIAVDYIDPADMEAFAEQYIAARQGEAFEVRVPAFFCVVLRRHVFEEIGPLDERFGLGSFVEDDYALRLIDKGYKCLCAEDVFIHRWSSATSLTSESQEYWQFFYQRLELFEAKWGIKWQPPHYHAEYLAEHVDINMREKIQLVAMLLARNKQIAKLEQEIAQRDQTIAEQEDTISQRNNWIAVQDKEINRLQVALTDIENSTSWKIVKAIWRLRLWLAPHGSKRERLMWNILAKIQNTSQKKEVSPLTESPDQRETDTSGFWIKAETELSDILSRYPPERPTIIFAPSINWKVPLFQRPQQMALAFAKQGYLVIFIEPPESIEFTPGFHQISPCLYVAAGLPMNVFGLIPSPLIFVLSYNKKYLSHFSSSFIVYEYIDELDVFPGDIRILQRDHEELVRSADLVIATAEKLLQHVQPIRPDGILCPNGVDYEYIQQTIQSTQAPPEELKSFVVSSRPIIGYYGALANWFDYDLVLEAAKRRPEYAFILIGPNYDGSINKSGILEQENITWLGPKSYALLPSYLKYFNVATIPFMLNEITHSTSPLKLFEYMSARKPIVTTAMHECERFPIVLIARDTDDFIAKLEQGLRLQTDPDYLKQVDQIARENTWTERAHAILAAYASQKGAIRK